MTSPELQTERVMKRSERFIRAIGGYSLGFLGISLQASGIASLNPLSLAAGTGITYLSHRIMNPYYNAIYGAPTRERTVLNKFVRFNVGLVPTYIGASLVSGAIFGGVGLNAAGRVPEGAIGLPVLAAGGLIEQRMHRGESLVANNQYEVPLQEVISCPEHILQPQGIFARIKTSFMNGFHNHMPNHQPQPNLT